MPRIYSLLREIVKDKYLLLLFTICVIVFISHSLYVLKTFQYPKWDEHIFLSQAVAAYDEIRSPSTETIANLLKTYQLRPPIYGMSITFLLLLSGGNYTYKLALFVNVIFYITSIIGIYFLARKFVQKTPSLLASLLYATYGFPLFYLHFVYSETATTTFVVLTMLSLAYSNGFTNKKYSILAGLFFFFGNITRWVTPIFVLGAIIAVLFQTYFRQKKIKRQKTYKNTLLFFTIGIGLSLLFYYLPNYFYFSEYAINSARQAPEWVETLNYLPSGLSNPFSTHSIMFYFNILSQQTVYLFLLFCTGFVICLLQFKKYLFLLLSFLIPYFFFTFMSVLKDDRYIVPIYPIMAIISAVVIEKIKPGIGRNLLMVLIVSITFLNFLGGSWGIGPLGKRGLHDIVLPEFIKHPRRIYLTTMVWPPAKDTTNSMEILSKIKKHKGSKETPTLLNTYTVNPLELDVSLSSLSIFERRGEFHPITLRVIDSGDYNELFSRLEHADFILVKSTFSPIKDNKFTGEKSDEMIRIFNNSYDLSGGKILSGFSKVETVYYPLDNILLDIYLKNGKLNHQKLSEIGKYLIDADRKNAEKIEQVINTYK